MKIMPMCTVLAWSALLSLAATASAEDWSFSELGMQLMGQPNQAPARNGRQLDAEYLAVAQNGADDAPQLESNPFANDPNGGFGDGAGEYCTDGSGNCFDQGDECCEYGGCPCDYCGRGDCNGCCASACGSGCACGDPACCGTCCPKADLGTCYAEVQVLMLRAHVMEEAAGKLSEKYEFTPRFVWGYESPAGVGLRGRYWTYGRTTPNLDSNEDPLRFEFQVLDLEGTSSFRSDRSELTLAGGFRWADIVIEEDDDAIGSDLPGITLAVDGRHAVCRGCNWHWAGVCGARWSMLGGDWEGDDNVLVEETRDDNLVVTEIYGGVEFLRRCGSCDVYARAVFEVQNWHSDAIGDASDTDSISFVGPGVHAGVNF